MIELEDLPFWIMNYIMLFWLLFEHEVMSPVIFVLAISGLSIFLMITLFFISFLDSRRKGK